MENTDRRRKEKREYGAVSWKPELIRAATPGWTLKDTEDFVALNEGAFKYAIEMYGWKMWERMFETAKPGISKEPYPSGYEPPEKQHDSYAHTRRPRRLRSLDNLLNDQAEIQSKDNKP